MTGPATSVRQDPRRPTTARPTRFCSASWSLRHEIMDRFRFTTLLVARTLSRNSFFARVRARSRYAAGSRSPSSISSSNAIACSMWRIDISFFLCLAQFIRGPFLQSSKTNGEERRSVWKNILRCWKMHGCSQRPTAPMAPALHAGAGAGNMAKNTCACAFSRKRPGHVRRHPGGNLHRGPSFFAGLPVPAPRLRSTFKHLSHALISAKPSCESRRSLPIRPAAANGLHNGPNGRGAHLRWVEASRNSDTQCKNSTWRGNPAGSQLQYCDGKAWPRYTTPHTCS